MYSFKILKLKSKVEGKKVQYFLPSPFEDVLFNDFIGKNIKLEFSGDIFCIATGKKIKKSYGQGYSFEAFMTLPECDSCMVRPELCHYYKGTCRDSKWGEAHCIQPHVIYLANSSGLKIGITKKVNIPTRWIDQGASEAIIIGEVHDRLTSGLIEVEISKKLNDKTNWRKMLSNGEESIDLILEKKKIINEFGEILKKYKVILSDDTLYRFDYPINSYLDKISSLSFDKTPIIEGKLLGIRGQYLILDQGVLNMRKHQGYFINFHV